jgi:hypothetical protein
MAESNASKFSSKITSEGKISQGGLAAGVGGTDWQAVITGAGGSSTAVAGEGYFIDTTSNTHTINLPTSPSVGDTIEIRDYAGTFGTNNVTLNTNGKKLGGILGNGSLDTNDTMTTIVYSGEDKGWLSVENESKTNLVAISYVTATGGTVSESGDYKIHTFTGDGCFVVSCAGNPLGSTQIDYMVVAGGGSGGYEGGGGAGGFRESHSTPVSGSYTASPLATPTAITVSTTTYPISVGGGGTGQGSGGTVSPGTNSVFSTITSAGGGGAGALSGPTCGIGGDGGSGGGGGSSGNAAAGSGNTPPVSPPQGNNGQQGVSGSLGGGGGGAAEVGGADGSSQGGDGVLTTISGTGTYYSGGGAGHPNSGAVVAGGSGGGASTNPGTSSPGNNGSANTGGAGAGSWSGTGGNGGTGIVILRYKFQ